MVSQKSQKLEDQAATAALYATRPDRSTPHDRPDRSTPHDRPDRLDNSSRLSSAGAATSLKYASPVDLPSYPSAGLTNIESSAGAAASLANANHQAFEYWKPDSSEAASRAAILAKDYKATELWQPQKSTTGSRAAALAAKDARSVDAWHPEATEAGNSAAGQAMRGHGLSAQVSSGFTAEGHNKALLAATGAMSGRKRSGSSPVTKSTYPDSENSAANALSAASFANKSSLRGAQARKDMTSSPLSATMDAAQLKNAAVTNLGREMYTSNPPVAPEVEEKNRQAGQRAAAISMAKQMYDVQQRAITQAQEVDRSDSHVAASYLHNRKQSENSMEESYQSPPQYANLQEAAQKLAAERLAKLHDEHAAYRNYYGTNVTSQSRLSVRNRPRRRASSDGSAHITDDKNSKPNRPEMSLIKENPAQTETQKRQIDRDLLMAAAQRNVKASMQSMDEKVFAETGRPSPAMVEDWDFKANARAKAASEARMVNHGKVNIGGGKYLDQSEIDEIAAKRVQPTLDEISEKAAIQRARDADLQRGEQERNRITAAKVQDERERNSKTKAEWKRFRDEEKREAKLRKEEGRTKRVDEKQPVDENKRLLMHQAKPGITSEDERATVPESAVSEPTPYLDPGSLEEPSEPASKTSRTDADLTGHESPNKSPIEAEPRSVADEANEANATSEVDPTLLDPALREPVVNEGSMPEKNYGERRPSDPSHAELVAARVLSAPSITDVPIEEAIKTVPGATNVRQDFVADPSHPSEATVPDENNVHQGLIADPSHASETTTAPDETNVHHNLMPDPSHPGEATVLDGINVHQDLVPDPSHLSGATNTAPRSPKGESRVTSWLKSKFSRRTAKSPGPLIEKSSQDPVGLEDDEGHKESPRRTSQSVSSISSDDGAEEAVPALRQRTSSGSHEDFKEAHDHLDSGKDSEERVVSGTSKNVRHSHDNQVRDSKFQENL